MSETRYPPASVTRFCSFASSVLAFQSDSSTEYSDPARCSPMPYASSADLPRAHISATCCMCRDAGHVLYPNFLARSARRLTLRSLLAGRVILHHCILGTFLRHRRACNILVLGKYRRSKRGCIRPLHIASSSRCRRHLPGRTAPSGLGSFLAPSLGIYPPMHPCVHLFSELYFKAHIILCFPTRRISECEWTIGGWNTTLESVSALLNSLQVHHSPLPAMAASMASVSVS